MAVVVIQRTGKKKANNSIRANNNRNCAKFTFVKETTRVKRTGRAAWPPLRRPTIIAPYETGGRDGGIVSINNFVRNEKRSRAPVVVKTGQILSGNVRASSLNEIRREFGTEIRAGGET